MWNGKTRMGRGRKYGYGWMDHENTYGKHIYSHDGGGKGFSSDLKIVKEDGYIVAVLINNRVNPGELSNNILSIIYKGTFSRPIKFLENQLMEIMEEKGFDYVKNNYAAILKEKGMDKTPNPWIYIQFGDMLENLKQPENAFTWYEMGRKEFPKEPNMCNVTGQFYVTRKEYKEAAVWFNKALELDPNDGFAKMLLNNIKDKLK
jgi:tetratricopeptide (TPR) repeat protein